MPATVTEVRFKFAGAHNSQLLANAKSFSRAPQGTLTPLVISAHSAIEPIDFDIDLHPKDPTWEYFVGRAIAKRDTGHEVKSDQFSFK
jgi:hypothetical protein